MNERLYEIIIVVISKKVWNEESLRTIMSDGKRPNLPDLIRNPSNNEWKLSKVDGSLNRNHDAVL